MYKDCCLTLTQACLSSFYEVGISTIYMNSSSTGGHNTNNIPINPMVVVFFKSALPQYYHDAPHVISVTLALSSSSADI